ncbi:hypothetical protein [Brevundimonas denitrificans]|uniref:hypothetical protein n=1 Tax=Brevundimonas denitrificans TaxID=1443434 RepID=UPI00223B7AD2|nr:hypothetical protein [Brevundimonas denitrificans]
MGTSVQMIEDHYGHINPVKMLAASFKAFPVGRLFSAKSGHQLPANKTTFQSRLRAIECL